MARVELSNQLFEYDEKVRIEAGPRLRTAKATEALLADTVTAHHYKLGGLDAQSNVIELNKPMTYLDWLNQPVWYVYRWEPVPAEIIAERSMAPDAKYWAEKGVYPTLEEAEATVSSLL
jgi:hypothetical protein